MRKAVLLLMLLSLAGVAAAQEIVRYFPGAASATGAEGAFFVTDARLYNPDPSETITVYLSFLDRDVDNSYLYLKVIGDPSISGVQMPRFRTPLSQELQDLVKDRIEAGAQNN